MSGYETILYEIDDRIVRITLNRRRWRNVQSTLLLRELDDAIMKAGDDRSIRVILLTGAGEHFSAGHDLARQTSWPGARNIRSRRAFAAITTVPGGSTSTCTCAGATCRSR